MSEPAYLKCPCRQCGGNIEFPAEAAGATVNCPHCSGQTVLALPDSPAGESTSIPTATDPPAGPGSKPSSAKPAPRHSGSGAVPVAKPAAKPAAKPVGKRPSEPAKPASRTPAPVPKPTEEEQDGGRESGKAYLSLTEADYDIAERGLRCRSCGAHYGKDDVVCPNCGSAVRTGLRMFRVVGGLLVVALGIAAPFTIPKKEKPRPNRPDFQMMAEQKWQRDGNLSYLVGTVTNNSEFRYIGVKVEFELFDRNGTTLGTTSDYVSFLEAGKAWNYRAIAVDPDAATAKLVSLIGKRFVEDPKAARERLEKEKKEKAEKDKKDKEDKKKEKEKEKKDEPKKKA
jgi:Zn finger protein HypA/HybF involved in hydrogenase expression